MIAIRALPARSVALRALAASAVVLVVASMQARPARSSADEDSSRFFASMGRPEWASVRITDSNVIDAERAVRGRRGKRVASLGGGDPFIFDKPSVTGGGGGITWHAPSSCLDSRLVSVVGEVAANFGRVRVSSTCRSRRHNARVGGAHRSHHLRGNAVDFRVFGNVRQTAAFLRSHASLGGVKHYGGGLFHIDTGPHRRW
jgi:hypothetical protein